MLEAMPHQDAHSCEDAPIPAGPERGLSDACWVVASGQPGTAQDTEMEMQTQAICLQVLLHLQ